MKGGFNPDAPTKEEQQTIDSFHDFWPLLRGIFKIFLKKDPNTQEIQQWHLMRAIIRWLLINYSVPALNLNLARSLLTTVPTYNFKFNPYTTNRRAGDLFFTSLLAPSNIEEKGRKYVKIPQAAIWQQSGNPHANFKALFNVLFPNTDANILGVSTMYMVCDSGSGEVRHLAERSIAAAGQNLDTNTKMGGMVGVITALAQAFTLVGDQLQQSIEQILIQNAANSLRLSSIPRRQQGRVNSDLCNIISSIYIAPLIIVAARTAIAEGPVGPIDVMARIAVISHEIIGRIDEPTSLQQLMQQNEMQVHNSITQRSQINFDSSALSAVYIDSNKLEIIISASEQIAAAILVDVIDKNNISQIITAANTATLMITQPIGPFVKEIITPQTSADSATANPKPSTIPGDVYPILYEFVAQERIPTLPRLFPESIPPVDDPANLFYSDANRYTYGRYELRYEKHEWNPITGLGFKFVIGDIQQANGQRYEIEYGIRDPNGIALGPDMGYNSLGPSAGLLAACCLKSVLQPLPQPLPQQQPPITYDVINQSLNYLLQQSNNRDSIIGVLTPLLDTIGNNNFTDRADMVHPYLQFEGNQVNGRFYNIPPETWLDMKRAGDRDQVMAAYQLSKLTNIDGTLKYPYLVFVTGDELCATMAVKKGLATIYQTGHDIRYWPKGIMYGPPTGQLPTWPVYFTKPRLQDQDFQMYNQPVAELPQGVAPQYSIDSWGGGKQMKGGDYYTMITPDQIEDGYGNKYNIDQLRPLFNNPQILFQAPDNYAFIYNIPENIQKLLLMNFGRDIDMGKILFALIALPQQPIICTMDELIAGLSHHNIINYVNTDPEIINTINHVVIQVQNNPEQAAAETHTIITNVRTPEQAAAAAVQVAAQAAVQNNDWVADMFAILRYSAVPNETEDDPLITVRPPGAEVDRMEKYDIEYMIKQFVYSCRKHGIQEIPDQFIITYGISPIFRHISKTFRGNVLPETAGNPVFDYIQERMSEYLGMPNLSTILSSFYTFCNMIPHNMSVGQVPSVQVPSASVPSAPVAATGMTSTVSAPPPLIRGISSPMVASPIRVVSPFTPIPSDSSSPFSSTPSSPFSSSRSSAELDEVSAAPFLSALRPARPAAAATPSVPNSQRRKSSRKASNLSTPLNLSAPGKKSKTVPRPPEPPRKTGQFKSISATPSRRSFLQGYGGKRHTKKNHKRKKRETQKKQRSMDCVSDKGMSDK